MLASTELRIAVGAHGSLSGLLLCPAGARFLYVLAHGAGAGMRHPFLEAIAHRLAEAEIATLRYHGQSNSQESDMAGHCSLF